MATKPKLACIILAAGKGTRMRSQIPKVLHKIGGKPMVMHSVDAALSLGADPVVIVTAPDMEMVRALLTQHYGKHITHAIQKEQRGTGDAVKAAHTALKNFKGTIIIMCGDTPLVSHETLHPLYKSLQQNTSASIAVMGMEINDENAYGRLVTDKNNMLLKIVETRDATAKEKSIALCNSGIMAVRSDILFALLSKLTTKNSQKEYYLTDIIGLANAAEKGAIVVTGNAPELMGVNSRSELASAERRLQEKLRKAAMENGATLLDPATVYFCADTKIGQDVVIYPHVIFGSNVTIGNNVEIRSFSHIEDAVIEANAVIGPFARLRPGSIIGESAHIGNFVEIKKSIIERGAKINHLTYVGDATVGTGTNIGAGTITANYDGYEKHRTTIGAGVNIGSNTCLVAPVTIGDRAVIAAGSIITDDVDADALAIARARQIQKPTWAKNHRNKKNN